MAIEVVTGKDLETYYRENIFEPLGIKEITSSPICQPCRSSCCKPMRGEKGEILRLCSFSCPPEEEMEASYPGAGLFADGAEYVTSFWLLCSQGTIRRRTILKPETVELLRKDQLEGSLVDNLERKFDQVIPAVISDRFVGCPFARSKEEPSVRRPQVERETPNAGTQ